MDDVDGKSSATECNMNAEAWVELLVVLVRILAAGLAG